MTKICCLFLCTLQFQVNVSELGLVTPAGKVVWGKIICQSLTEILTEINVLKSCLPGCR